VDDAYSLRNEPTVSALAEEYLSKHANPKNRPQSVTNGRSMPDLFVLPRLAKLKVAVVRHQDIQALHNGMRATAFSGHSRECEAFHLKFR